MLTCFSLSQLYKHVVQIVEKFIKKVRQTCQFSHHPVSPHQTWINPNQCFFFCSLQCKPEYKVAGLYVVDSIVRQSRHQFGADKDVFGPRFTKNITGTFENLCLCPVEDRVRTERDSGNYTLMNISWNIIDASVVFTNIVPKRILAPLMINALT